MTIFTVPFLVLSLSFFSAPASDHTTKSNDLQKRDLPMPTASSTAADSSNISDSVRGPLLVLAASLGNLEPLKQLVLEYTGNGEEIVNVKAMVDKMIPQDFSVRDLGIYRSKIKEASHLVALKAYVQVVSKDDKLTTQLYRGRILFNYQTGNIVLKPLKSIVDDADPRQRLKKFSSKFKRHTLPNTIVLDKKGANPTHVHFTSQKKAQAFVVRTPCSAERLWQKNIFSKAINSVI